jgi:hypothetical protein
VADPCIWGAALAAGPNRGGALQLRLLSRARMYKLVPFQLDSELR